MDSKRADSSRAACAQAGLCGTTSMFLIVVNIIITPEAYNEYMPIRIVTDSTCDLPAALAEEYAIRVVPCFINLENQSYLDEVQLSRRQFYEKIPSLRSPPTTSSPGIGTFVEVYRRLAFEGASEILSIHVSGSLSNIPNIARMAVEGLLGYSGNRD